MEDDGQKKRPAGADPKFMEQMDNQLAGWDAPAARMREALEFDHFTLYAQPIVPLQAGAGQGLAEVLVRLRAEEARMLPPGDFLPAFEHYKMMSELDRWVVRNALRNLEHGGKVARLCVNVSGQALEEAGFVPFVAMQLRLTGVEAAALIFEIDENDALDRRAAAERFAIDIKKLGCSVLLDGFARRSVSFEPLSALLADFVKVDGAVTRHILKADTALAKMRAIVRVGQVTGIGVIAECVEEEPVRERLVELGVAYAQGFGIGEPQPIERLFGVS